MTAITFDHLEKRFGAQHAVDGVNLEIPDGAFVVLLGPSGCGKTTTLRMLAGLEDPSGGEIRFGDRVVADAARSMPSAQRGLGMVFQSYALWPHMRVRQNIDWPLRVAGWKPVDRAARVAEVLELLELDGLAERFPAELSGGQQQRVAIARTIAPKPGVLLFDEPLSNLDARLRVDTRAELVRVHRASGATSVYVTHDQVEALAMATHIAVMRDGRVEQLGTPMELLERPATAFVASFLGTPPHVLLEAVVEGGRVVRGDVVLAERATGAADGDRVQAMYRAHEVDLDADGQLDAEILEATPVAGSWIVTVRVGSERVSVVTAAPRTAGDTTRLRLPAAPTDLFGGDGRQVAVVAR
jgi:iron(III) transport system ATP-binding protein